MPDSSGWSVKTDTHVDEVSPDSNFGSLTTNYAYLGVGFTRYYLINMTPAIDPWAGKEIGEAALKLYVSDKSSGDVVLTLHRLTAPFTEGTVTWNTKPTFEATAEDTVTVSSAGWIEFDVRDVIQDKADGVAHYGYLIQVSTANKYVGFESCDALADNPIIEYELASVPSAPQSPAITSNSSSLNLSWTAPSDNGYRDITAYSIYRGTVSGSLSLLDTTTYLYYSDIDIKKGTTYYYHVTATNDIGEGSASSEVSDALDDRNSGVGPVFWFKTTVQVYNRSGADGYNKSTFDNPFKVKARVQFGSSMTTAPSGETIMSACKIYVDGSITVDPQDKVELPDGEVLTVKQVDVKKGPSGTDWIKVIIT